MSRGAGTRWRTLALAVSAASLVGSLFVAVRVDGAARSAITATDSLRDRAQSAREALNRGLRRADSLASRPRILRVAGRMGFRPAEDTEVRYLPDVTRDSSRGETERGGP